MRDAHFFQVTRVLAECELHPRLLAPRTGVRHAVAIEGHPGGIASLNGTTTNERVSTLRGAGVGEVDGRRVRRAVVIACALVLAVVAASLFVAGARKNDEITSLRRDGVPVVVTVTSCMGLLGGSGSNAAGYTCRGRFMLDGHRHVDTIPGDLDRPPGTKVHAVSLASDPGLLATADQLSTEHASARVYLLPSGLVLVLAVAVAVGTFLVRRRSSARGPGR